MIRRCLVLAGVVLLLAGAILGGWHLWAAYQLSAARHALDHYQVAEARRHLEACLRIWPRSGAAHLLLARIDRLSDDLDGAQSELDLAQELGVSPEDAALEWAMLRAQGGDLDTVESSLRARVDKKHPQSALIIEAAAEGNLRLYRILQALTLADRWQELQPDNPRAWFFRGRAWQRVHAYEKAADAYRHVVELDPGHDDARLRLANALLETSHWEEAITELEVVRQRRPDDSEVLVRLAFGHTNLGHTDEAFALLDRLLAAQPDFAPALTARGQLALQSGQQTDAERWLRRSLDFNPYDRQANFLYYQCLQQLGKEAEAREQLVKLRRVETAVERLLDLSNRQMSKRPRDPALHCELARTLQSLGQEEMALRWYYSALNQDPACSAAHAALAEYYERKGDAQQAEEHRQQVGRHAEASSRSAGPGTHPE